MKASSVTQRCRQPAITTITTGARINDHRQIPRQISVDRAGAALAELGVGTADTSSSRTERASCTLRSSQTPVALQGDVADDETIGTGMIWQANCRKIGADDEEATCS